ncbi:Sorbin and SH3 domain-containing protein 1 [Chytriomyces hyalinus]|nr:Sorbin and SH3 domain-containing protein 1 [Chytriomyces hyalinus]
MRRSGLQQLHYFVFLDQSTATPAFSNVSSFDKYMQQWADNSPEFASQMQTQYSCPGWTTTTLALRYHLTSYCGVWAYIGSTMCPVQQGASPQMSPVCKDPVMDFVASWNNVMNNASICSSNPTTEVAKRRDTYLGLFTELLKGGLSNQGCTIAVAADAGSFCGFQTAKEGQSWCDQNHDVCCAFNSQLKQVLLAPLETPAALTSSRTSDSNVSTTSTSVPIVPIAIGGGIVLVLIITILTCCVWRAAPAKRRSHASPDGLHRAPSFEMRSNDGGAVKSWDERNQMDAYSNSQFQQTQNIRPGYEASASSRNSYYKPVVPQVGSNKWGVPLSPGVAAMNAAVVGDPRVKNYWAIVNFRPENPDEMPLVIGDVITIRQIYNDDWCFGRNLSKQIEGIFPFECVAEVPNANNTSLPSKNKFNRRESSLYGDSNQIADDGSFTVIFAYYPSMADEIELHIGDRAAVVESYDDGWAFGVNMTTRAEGLFPLDILENYTSKTPMGLETLRRIRESSRYSTFSTLKKPTPTPQPIINLKNTTPQPSFPIQKQNASPQPTFPQKQPTPQPFPPSAAASSFPSFAGKSYFVIYDFKPIQPDEVTLRVGDRVTIKQNYDDGWALGLNVTTKLEGLFPLDTLAIDASRETLQRKNRQSSIYESLKNGSERVVYDFMPERPDEIKLRVGDEVVVNQEFDDGWAFGVNITTNEEGNFPLDCLSSYTEPPPASVASSKKPKQRVSSIYETASTTAATGEKVIYDFNPERPDEIELRVGDVVVITQSFDDGWAIGTNLRTKQEGNFPLDCLASTAEPATPAKNQRSRQSSLYDAKDYEPTNTNSLYTTSGLKTTDSYYAPNTNSMHSAAGTTATQSVLPRSDTAIFDFKPERSDEIELRKGDTVIVQQEFDDGWGFGVNNRTNKKGNFPCDCLSSYADPSGTMPTLKSKHRVSSVYGDSDYAPDEQLPVPPLDVANLGSDEVAHSFSTSKPDEVPLSVGDRVMIKKAYDDGWCYGVNLVNQMEGYFPYDCLMSYAKKHPQIQTASSGKKQRVSSIYDENIATPKQAAAPAAVVSGTDTSVKVIFSFNPVNPDEVALKTGDKVIVQEEYDDGWAYGVNLTTKAEGSFPLDCLENYQEDSARDAPKPEQRRSSLYGVGSAIGVEDTRAAIYNFIPERDDELALNAGDLVLVKHIFEDGWSFGVNLANGYEGNFPTDCVKLVPNPKKRFSSIQRAPNSNNSMYVQDAALQLLTAVENFRPERDDEITLFEGDKVKVLQAYDDGWCFVRNVSTGEEGLVPEDCVDGLKRTGAGSTRKQRVSSLYGASY